LLCPALWADGEWALPRVSAIIESRQKRIADDIAER